MPGLNLNIGIYLAKLGLAVCFDIFRNLENEIILNIMNILK